MKKPFLLYVSLSVAFLLATTAWSTVNTGEEQGGNQVETSLSGRACGDVNGDGNISVTDLTVLTSYLLTGGPPPANPGGADMDGCPGLTIEDLDFLAEYLFCSGPSPCTGPPCNTATGGYLYLDHIRGLSTSGLLLPGLPISYQIGITNDQGAVISSIGNGFRVYSSTGASWTSTSGDTVGLGSSYFDQAFIINEFSADGLGADTVSFSGLGLCGSGLPAGYDDIAISVDIGPIDIADSGGEICIDSSWYSPEGEWLWSLGPGERRTPDWDGPYCYNIADYYCGDVDADGFQSITVEDLVYLVSYFFNDNPLPINVEAADMDGCPGLTVDDLVYLVDYMFQSGPAPCEGPACNEVDGGVVLLDHVDGQSAGGSLSTGSPIIFHLRYTNDLGEVISGLSNGFRVYSPTGAQWDHSTADSTGSLGLADFPNGFRIGYAGADGIGADTIGLRAAGENGVGMPVGFDDIVMTIEIGPIANTYAGGQICLDSSWMPSQGLWTWGAGSGERRVPAWLGPYCFDISSALCGDVNEDGTVDVVDVNILVNYLFYNGPAPSADAADMDGCPGVTQDDLIFLTEYIFCGGPAPCEGPGCTTQPGGMITLDHVTGQLSPGVLMTDMPITFNIRVTNNTGSSVPGVNNGFRVYSPTGVQWTTTIGDTTNALGMSQLNHGFQIDHFSIDGMGADTVGFYGVGGCDSAMPGWFDDVAYTIKIGPIDPIYDGGQICLDSSWFPERGEWMWNAGSSMRNIPEWGGPYCFDISDAPPTCGDLNCDGAMNIPDLAVAIDYLWGSNAPLPCPEVADVDDHELFTVHDMALWVRYTFAGGAIPPICPPSQPPLQGPVRDSIFLHTYESAFPSQAYFPASDSTYTVHVHFTTDITLDCVSLPFHIRVGNDIPIIDSITVPASGFETQYYNYMINQDSGIIVLDGFSVIPEYYLTPGTYEVGQVHLSMAAQDSIWRPITIGWDSIPPAQNGKSVHYRFVTEPGGQAYTPSIYRLPCLMPIRGDMDYNGGEITDISDLVFLVDYMFNGGPSPRCFEEADVLLDGFLQLDIGDLVYFVDYMFSGGPPPPPCPEEAP